MISVKCHRIQHELNSIILYVDCMKEILDHNGCLCSLFQVTRVTDYVYILSST